MAEPTRDVEQELPEDVMRLDGNAVAGTLYDWFGGDMTAVPAECASCGNVAMLATLFAYTRGPGVVLRCSICLNVVVRVVETPYGSFLDARGIAWVRRP